MFFSQHVDETERGAGGYGEWHTTCEKDPRFTLSGSGSSCISAEMAIDQAIRAKQFELELSDEYMDTLSIVTTFSKY